MKKKNRLKWGIAMVLCILFLMPVTTNAAKKININRYLRFGKNYTIFAYDPTQQWINIWKKKSTKSEKYPLQLCYGGSVTVDTGKLRKGVKTAWIPVIIYQGRRKSTGYVLASQVKLQALYTKKLSQNPIINKALKTGLQYLGTPFQMPGSSLSNGIDCAQFVSAIYRAAGRNLVSWAHTDNLQAVSRQIFYHTLEIPLNKKQLNMLKPGDLLFYLKYDSSGPIDHVAVYLGNGFMINSSGHYGTQYPNGGICVKRVQYGARRIVRAMRINGF